MNITKSEQDGAHRHSSKWTTKQRREEFYISVP